MIVMVFFHSQAPLDTIFTASSALQATEFSRTVSNLGPCGFDIRSICTLNNGISESSNEHKDKSGSALRYCNTSAVTPTSKKKNTCGEDGEDCHCHKNTANITLSEVEACFCYSCRLIAREMVCMLDFFICYIVLRNCNQDNQLVASHAVKKLNC